MEELDITVKKMTADALRKATARISAGEAADRYTPNAAREDPCGAFILAIEHYFTCVSGLSEEDCALVLGDICSLFLGSVPREELDNFVAALKRTRGQGHFAIELTAEERDEFRKTISHRLQAAKDEYLRTVFYNAIYG